MENYIAIEGLKGAGKTTIIQGLKKILIESGMRVNYYTPFKEEGKAPSSLMDPNAMRNYSTYDDLQEWSYAACAIQTAKQIDWSNPLIIGDRSIATSYVTRWHKYESPLENILRVDKSHAEMPIPAKILFLEIAPKMAFERIQNREKRTYGIEQETMSSLEKQYEAYHALINRKIAPRMKDTQFILIDATLPAEKVIETTFNIIQSSISKS
jgi:thymidylate kinase